MEFLTSIPAKAIIPTMAVKERLYPAKNKIPTAPITPRGITESTINELLKVLNSNIKMAKIPKIVMIISLLDQLQANALT